MKKYKMSKEQRERNKMMRKEMILTIMSLSKEKQMGSREQVQPWILINKSMDRICENSGE